MHMQSETDLRFSKQALDTSNYNILSQSELQFEYQSEPGRTDNGINENMNSPISPRNIEESELAAEDHDVITRCTKLTTYREGLEKDGQSIYLDQTVNEDNEPGDGGLDDQ